MPYEEYYNPTDDAVFDDSKKDKSVEKLREFDRYYQKHVKVINDTWTDGKFYKKVNIQSYGSGQVGTRIRNAVTGQYYSYLVGSVNEDLLFKVIDAVGRNERKDPLFLFYDSPEQYENHQFVHLEQPLKEAWYNKNLAARAKQTN